MGTHARKATSLASAIADLDEECTLQAVRRLLGRGCSPLYIVEECRKGLAEVGEKYARGEYFLSDLVMSAELFREVMALIWPVWVGEQPSDAPDASIAVGTVHGDIHDIGKNIVVSLLRSHGFQVRDLGIDVPPNEFVRQVRTGQARIVGMSGLVTAAFDSMKTTVELLCREGLRDRVFVMIGGLVDDRVAKYVGADAWVRDAAQAIPLCTRVLRPGQQDPE
ncbi:MAG: cobalamin-dependent protein [Bacillota bacterium]|nr:cobalamin-dependent protein [Bacillota bacterium]